MVAGTSSDPRPCRALEVPGGAFLRDNDSRYPATVTSFWLDEHEVTVARFRQFLADYDAWRQVGHPAPDQAPLLGASPGVAWRSEFTAKLPASARELESELTGPSCVPHEVTWTKNPGAHDSLPINCITWFEAFAFCLWDGGQLPTELQFNYAAAGGAEQRKYPWGNEEPRDESRLAIHNCLYSGKPGCSLADIAPVGSAPEGRARFGHLDLAGSMREWVFDRFADPYLEGECHDCANADVGENRSFRGGSWYQGKISLETAIRNNNLPTFRSDSLGFRCARLPPSLR